MRALLLAACLAGAGALLMWAAQVYHLDVASPNRLPHPAGTLLAVNFAHADHVEQTCISCHHNYVDDTGFGNCLDCHKSNTEVSPLIETQFHTLCRDCHIDKQAAGEDHGPTRQCIACHIPDDRP